MDDVSRETAAHLQALVDDWSDLQALHDLLASTGVERGLIGPREAPRLWDRHIGNCAVAVVPSPSLVPIGSTVADVGSGAGLPGLVWALVRPDLDVILVEPLLRRSTFLSEAVDSLGLQDRVQVIRDRAEALDGQLAADVVTARAVAPLDRLLAWTMPLCRPGGRVLAFKGRSADEELKQAMPVLTRLGGGQARVTEVGQGITQTPVRIVEIIRPD